MNFVLSARSINGTIYWGGTELSSFWSSDVREAIPVTEERAKQIADTERNNNKRRDADDYIGQFMISRPI